MKISFQEYVNAVYGTEVDLCDLTPIDYDILYDDWNNADEPRTESNLQS